MRQLPLILERGDEAGLSADAGGRSGCSLFLQVQYLLHQLYLKQMDVLRPKAPRHPAQDVELMSMGQCCFVGAWGVSFAEGPRHVARASVV